MEPHNFYLFLSISKFHCNLFFFSPFFLGSFILFFLFCSFWVYLCVKELCKVTEARGPLQEIHFFFRFSHCGSLEGTYVFNLGDCHLWCKAISSVQTSPSINIANFYHLNISILWATSQTYEPHGTHHLHITTLGQ